jgi:CO/xanthine dehydrogenase Mo-binding subunit
MTRIEERLRFERDGTVTALSGKMEYGQGLRAAYPRIVAEELGIDPERVSLVLGDTDRTPWDMGTFGSMSVEMDGRELRRAAAFARTLLIARAAERWGCPASGLEIGNGVVCRPSDGCALTFGELAAAKPITGIVPDDVRLASPTPTCADSPSGPDAVDLLTGRLEFAGDVRIPGMLFGAVLHASVQGATLRSIDRAAAMALPGIVAIVEDAGLTAVVAERQDQIFAALTALKPDWGPPPARLSETTDTVLRGDADVETALASASTRLCERYSTPHIAGSPLGPSVGVADIRGDSAVIYGSTQAPFRLREVVARIAGLPVEHVHFRPKAMSGGFGRHGASDAAVEAARLSKAVGRPVLVQWGRADELRAGPNRPEMTAEIEAALDVTGRIVGWRSDVWTNPYTYDAAVRAQDAPSSSKAGSGSRSGAWSSPSQMMAMMAGRNAIPPYDIGHATIALHVTPAKVRTGALRSLGAAPNVFAIESFVDELAAAAGQDPIAFRLAYSRDPRLRRVLEAVRERSGWRSAARRPGLGVACVVYRQTYVAEVVEVAVTSRGAVTLERVWCAVDPGHVVHPDGARNQVEGAVQMAASWTLLEELPHRGGEVTGSTWTDYPIARSTDAPRSIDIVFTGDDRTPPSGLGEPPAVPMAPAIANAIFDARGARVRQLPIRPDAVLRALASAGR